MKTISKYVFWLSLSGLVTLGMLLAFASCTGCGTTPTPPTPGPGQDTCDLVCAYGVKLGCDWSAPTAGGAPCADVCRNAQTVLPWRTDCIAAAASCAQAAACQK